MDSQFFQLSSINKIELNNFLFYLCFMIKVSEIEIIIGVTSRFC